MAVADPGLKQVVLRNSTWTGCLVYSAVKQLAGGAELVYMSITTVHCTQIMVGETCLLYHSVHVRTYERASLAST